MRLLFSSPAYTIYSIPLRTRGFSWFSSGSSPIAFGRNTARPHFTRSGAVNFKYRGKRCLWVEGIGKYSLCALHPIEDLALIVRRRVNVYTTFRRLLHSVPADQSTGSTGWPLHGAIPYVPLIVQRKNLKIRLGFLSLFHLR